MRKTRKILLVFVLALVFTSMLAVPAFAVTEAEVQQQVNAIGREGVTGNIFIWFLCAIGFLKVSQKIDSFMSSLGSMWDILVAPCWRKHDSRRGIASVKSFGGHGGGGSRSGASSGGSSGGGFASGRAWPVLLAAASRIARSKTPPAAKKGGLSGKAFASSLEKGGGFANRVIARWQPAISRLPDP